jgi:hypothetical protein
MTRPPSRPPNPPPRCRRLLETWRRVVMAKSIEDATKFKASIRSFAAFAAFVLIIGGLIAFYFWQNLQKCKITTIDTFPELENLKLIYQYKSYEDHFKKYIGFEINNQDLIYHEKYNNIYLLNNLSYNETMQNILVVREGSSFRLIRSAILNKKYARKFHDLFYILYHMKNPDKIDVFFKLINLNKEGRLSENEGLMLISAALCISNINDAKLRRLKIEKFNEITKNLESYDNHSGDFPHQLKAAKDIVTSSGKEPEMISDKDSTEISQAILRLLTDKNLNDFTSYQNDMEGNKHNSYHLEKEFRYAGRQIGHHISFVIKDNIVYFYYLWSAKRAGAGDYGAGAGGYGIVKKIEGKYRLFFWLHTTEV